MIVNMNLNQPKYLPWYLVLAALTSVSACPSAVEPTTIFADFAPPTHPLGVVGQNDAGVKRHLRTNSNTTDSVDGENEDRVFDIVQGLPASGAESIEAGLREAGVLPEVSAAVDHAPVAMIEKSAEASVLPGVAAIDKDHDSVAKVGELVEKTGDTRIREPQEIFDELAKRFEEVMGDQIESYRKQGNLFKSDRFEKWSKSIKKAYPEADVNGEEAKVSALLIIYGDMDVLRILADGRKDLSTQKIVNQLENSLMRKWCEANNEDNAMTLLTSGKDDSKILMSDSLEIWLGHYRDEQRNPYEVFVDQFTKRFGDKKLAEVLAVAKTIDGTKKIATQFAKYQLMAWKNRGIGVRNSYELLGLNDVPLKKLFANPTLSMWISYVKTLRVDPYEVYFLALTNVLSDEKLYLILAAAKADGTNESIRRMLQDKLTQKFIEKKYPQVKRWQTERKSGDNVFELLDLPGKGNDMFDTEAWSEWVAYLTFLEKQKEPKDQREIASVIFLKLKSRFDSEELTNLIATAKNVKKTKLFAKKWEPIGWWTAEQSSGKVFDLLELQNKGKDMFDTEAWTSWVAYLTFLEEQKGPTNRREIATVIFLELESRFGSEELTNLIATAKHVEKTKELAAEWERIEWLKAKRSPGNVFGFLKLKSKDTKMFETEAWSSWVAYLTFLEKHELLSETRDIKGVIFSVLRSQFQQEELARLIAAAKNFEKTKNFAAAWERRMARAKAKQSAQISKIN